VSEKGKAGVLGTLARQQIMALTFRSNVTPAIRIHDPLGPVNPSLFGEIVKPYVVLHTKMGDQEIAPWGKPRPWVFPVVVCLALVGLTSLGYLAYKGITT
jgi:hypothetical protein